MHIDPQLVSPSLALFGPAVETKASGYQSALISSATDPGGVTLAPWHAPLCHQADKTHPV